jgi:branched-chain amino acid transport system substrate-binding protein
VAAVQVILAALAKSDGTRASVTNAVFSGAGITVPKETSVLGKEIVIDPKSGDTSAKDISIEQVKDNQETFVQPETVS